MAPVGAGTVPADRLAELQRRITYESSKPLTVAVMGQTGVGKSSLVNAIFGTALATDAVRPTTKEPASVTIGEPGRQLTFTDLPGLGEDVVADERYLAMYVEQLRHADVALWAFQGDTRSITFDLEGLRRLLAILPAAERAGQLNKIVFTLTKADLAQDLWYLMCTPHKGASFMPENRGVLDEKARYFEEQLARADLVASRAGTYDDLPESMRLPAGLSRHDGWLTYDGYLDEATARQLSAALPAADAAVQRLRDNYRVLPCSARYRYNLLRLVQQVIHKIDPSAVRRFQRHVERRGLDQVDLKVAAGYRNLIALDVATKQLIVDPTRSLHDWERANGRLGALKRLVG